MSDAADWWAVFAGKLLYQGAKSWYKLTSTFGIAPSRGRLPELNAGIAQLVEQLICNQQVVGSNPTAGSLVKS